MAVFRSKLRKKVIKPVTVNKNSYRLNFQLEFFLHKDDLLEQRTLKTKKKIPKEF
jgi:hypothetical protein